MRPIRTLVVDNRQTYIDLVTQRLSISGYFDVRSTTNGADVEALLAEESFDLVIVDWGLAEEGKVDVTNNDGIVIAHRIRNNPANDQVAVIVVTATYNDDELDPYRADQDEKRILYITKDPIELLIMTIAASFFLTWRFPAELDIAG